jgi:peptidoglycan/xylan/chitin deacetylase (PgdA/CDA1 family)
MTLKNAIVLSVSFAVYVFDCVRRATLRMAGRRHPGTCVVLLYHAIPAAERAAFARQMRVLCRVATPLDEHLDQGVDIFQRKVLVTFDDGLLSFLENALPELEKLRIPSILFVVSGALGTPPGWSRYSSEQLPQERTLTEEELRALTQTVLIGSHTVTHPMLTLLGKDEARSEIRESRIQLEQLVRKPVRLFSFPYGAFNEELIACCKEEGYGRVFSTLPLLANASPNEFTTGRVNVSPADSGLEFRLKICGCYRWLPWAFRIKRNLQSQRRRMTPRLFVRSGA